MLRELGFASVSLMMIAMLNASAFAGGVIKILDKKGGKTLLVVDDESVRKEAGGKALLWIDDKKILTEKDGPMLFFMPGDILMDKMDGNVCGYVDGRNILDKPSGKHLLYINGPEIKEPDVHGKIVYYIDGEGMNNQQMMSVLYILRPDLIKRPGPAPTKTPAVAEKPAASPAAPATPASPATPAKPAAPAASADFAGGSYTFTDDMSKSGAVTITKKGEIFAIEGALPGHAGWQGVAVQQGDELFAAFGPANTVGLVVYKIDGGNLAGTWMNIGGDSSTFGSENLTGAPALGGAYQITTAKAPFTGAAYAGTVNISKGQQKGEVPFFKLNWELGTFKAKGIAFKSGSNLVGVSSSAPTGECAICHFKIGPDGKLTGTFSTVDGGTGAYTGKKG